MMELHNEYMPEILDALCRSYFTRMVVDAELNREIAQTILTEAGLQVVSVENGKLAVDYMAQCKPGFIDLVRYHDAGDGRLCGRPGHPRAERPGHCRCADHCHDSQRL